jgi:anti-sigma factor RsiW
MPCDVWRNKLDAYQDGELPAQETRDLETHLGGCVSCATALRESVKLRRKIQVAGRRYVASPEFRLRVLANAAPQRRWSGFWKTAPMAALAALVIAASFLLYRSIEEDRRNQALTELVDLHVVTLASANPLDVVSSDRHTVKPWFQGRIPFTFNLPELAGTGFQLNGARVSYFRQSPGAQLIFQKDKHQISVFVFPDSPSSRGLPEQQLLDKVQFHIQSWTSAGLRFFVVGDIEPNDIRELSNLMQHANHS